MMAWTFPNSNDFGLVLLVITEDADYTMKIGEHRFGFVDRTYDGFGRTWAATTAELGALGSHSVPVSAGMAWALVVAALLVGYRTDYGLMSIGYWNRNLQTLKMQADLKATSSWTTSTSA